MGEGKNNKMITKDLVLNEGISLLAEFDPVMYERWLIKAQNFIEDTQITKIEKLLEEKSSAAGEEEDPEANQDLFGNDLVSAEGGSAGADGQIPEEMDDETYNSFLQSFIKDTQKELDEYEPDEEDEEMEPMSKEATKQAGLHKQFMELINAIKTWEDWKKASKFLNSHNMELESEYLFYAYQHLIEQGKVPPKEDPFIGLSTEIEKEPEIGDEEDEEEE